MNTLLWLEDSFIGTVVSGSEWGYPIILSLHAIGMATLVGIAFMLTIHAVGFASSIPMTAMVAYWRVAVGGFILNTLSGIGLFLGSASELFFNGAFRIKIALVITGLLLTWQFVSTCVNRSDEVSGKHKALAGIVMATWFTAIISGRLIGYVA